MLDKKDILKCAKALFNEKGYNQTSMRDISGTLGISVGNLTYHYKKKEDILIDVMSVGWDERYHNVVVNTLDELVVLIDSMLTSIMDNYFYFNDPQLIISVPKIAKQHADNMEKLVDYLRNGLLSLCNQGILVMSEAAIDAFVNMLLYAHIGWLHQGNQDKDTFIGEHLILLQSFISKDKASYISAIIKKYS